MKGIKFEKLDGDERVFCDSIFSRCKAKMSVEAIYKLSIAKIVQRPWMCVILKNGKSQGIGFSKQATYAPMKDEWNEEIGGKIALSRAIRDMLGE